MIPSRSVRTRSQSSSRPIISVMTGPMSSIGRPSASRRRRPRSTASAAATACATLKRDGGIDVDAPVGRLLHDPHADGRGRELDDDVRGERREPDALRQHPVVGAEEGRVGLHREAALPPAGRLERRKEQGAARSGHLLDDGPREVDLGGVRSFDRASTRTRSRQIGRVALPDVGDDRRVGGRADGADRRWRTRARRPRTSRSRCRWPSSRWFAREGCRLAGAGQPTARERRHRGASTAIHVARR